MKQDEEEGVVAQGFQLLRGKEKDRQKAIIMLDQELGPRMTRYFIRHKVHVDDAEELVWNVWLKLDQSISGGKFRNETRPVIYMWTIARNEYFDYHRRAGGATFQGGLDEPELEGLLASMGKGSIHRPGWLKLCVERALAEMEGDYPMDADILQRWVEGWSAEEIATFLGISNGAARDRTYRVRMRAEGYLQHCKDEQ